jgi:hypothetical protein
VWKNCAFLILQYHSTLATSTQSILFSEMLKFFQKQFKDQNYLSKWILLNSLMISQRCVEVAKVLWYLESWVWYWVLTIIATSILFRTCCVKSHAIWFLLIICWQVYLIFKHPLKKIQIERLTYIVFGRVELFGFKKRISKWLLNKINMFYKVSSPYSNYHLPSNLTY